MAAWVNRKSRSSRVVHNAVQAVPFEGLEGRLMLAGDVPWRINGDRGGVAINDEIVIQVCETDGRKFEAVVNGEVVARQWRSRVHQIIINGRNGHDDILIDLGVDNENVSVSVFGGSGNDTIQGGAEDDHFWGGYGKDSIDGGMGDDDLAGGGGNDLITGDEGDDYLAGNLGNDTMSGGMGDDTLVGQSGNDQLTGGWGNDCLSGGIGEDTVYGGGGVDRLSGGRDQSVDTIYHEEVDHWKNKRFDITQEDTHMDPAPVRDAAALKQWAVDAAVARWRWAFGKSIYYFGDLFNSDGTYYHPIGDIMRSIPVSHGLGVSGSGSHSETNTQEEHVDETDIVKADDEFLYLIQDNELVIIDAFPAEEMHEVTRIDLSCSSVPTYQHGRAVGMYLNGDRLTVISEVYEEVTIDDGLPPGSPDQGAAELNYDSDPPLLIVGTPRLMSTWEMVMNVWDGHWTKPYVRVTVYDITDRQTPTILTETFVNGRLSCSRQLDSRLFLAVNTSTQIVRPEILNSDSAEESGELLDVPVPEGQAGALPWEPHPDYIYESEETYRSRLEAMSLDELVPQYTTIIHNPDGSTAEKTGNMIDASNLYIRENDLSNDMFSVAMLNIGADEPAIDSATTVLGGSGVVYVSQHSLYVTMQEGETPLNRWQGNVQTNIYRFALEQDQAAYEGAGRVPGWVLNQFSMDEEGGYLRIVTTTTGETPSSNLFVLQDTGDTLDIVGSLTAITTEQVQSTRFLADRAFLATYQRPTGSLFAIDLSNPRRPKIRGAVETQGYSAYLHSIDNDLLLGFGHYECSYSWISLFDVSNMKDPQLVEMREFSCSNANRWWWGYSTHEWGQHVFSYFAEYGILAVPVLDPGCWTHGAKLEILRITPSGFESLGEIEHSGDVRCSVRLGKYLYSIGTYAVKTVAIDDPTTIIAEVQIAEPAEPPTGNDDRPIVLD